MVFFIFLFWFFILSIYSPTWVSKTLPQKSLFARTNRIPKRMLRVTIINWVSHKTAILNLAVFIFPRWSSLVILLHISFVIFAFLFRWAERHRLTIEILIIYDSWFLFIHHFIALQFAWKFLLFVAVIEKFVSTFIIITDIIIRQINRVTFVLGNFQLTGRLTRNIYAGSLT